VTSDVNESHEQGNKMISSRPLLKSFEIFISYRVLSTEHIKIEWKEYKGIDDRSYSCPMDYAHIPASDRIDWLNAHRFDYRGLIPKGLAIEVTKENNPYKIAEE
jgi:hypothetical protein